MTLLRLSLWAGLLATSSALGAPFAPSKGKQSSRKELKNLFIGSSTPALLQPEQLPHNLSSALQISAAPGPGNASSAPSPHVDLRGSLPSSAHPDGGQVALPESAGSNATGSNRSLPASSLPEHSGSVSSNATASNLSLPATALPEHSGSVGQSNITAVGVDTKPVKFQAVQQKREARNQFMGNAWHGAHGEAGTADEDPWSGGSSQKARASQKGRRLLGLPKIFWALILTLAAMTVFVLLIPVVLTVAKKRRLG